ncbi:succinyl-CoA synthetase beta subunit [Methylomarinovum caldicuralii]|uniref:Succinate--CoA ligase [ADP-forming] subunit beta n=1 Tax=Methylomarinovum caldicuralii TaxID=438856 RepID=A0AAU9CT73_9GAMM|nr:ADP-forming succinate--CoA ligase subunit beta [Methylomarinovum caldicuralii]BCX82692.1 succinyl-CoA synthetase beta subunit [Methylomarinovum caldicuralii]
MNIHEYQAKSLLAEYGIPVPAGEVAETAAAARRAAESLSPGPWLVKAQIHAGARGKAGGVVLARTPEEVAEAAARLLGKRLVTAQTDARGLPVHRVLVERATDIARELYLSLTIDRSAERIGVVGSASGGMDIEEVARQQPEAIQRFHIHPAAGFQPYQGREMAFAMGLDAAQARRFVQIIDGLQRLFRDKDASQIELNPLAVTADGDLVALDAKLNFDDNALYAHPDIEILRDPAQEDEKERRAREHGLSYVALDGDIGCMVNGAGLAMATLDLVKQCGGEPANFLDVGGGVTAERVAGAFKIILSDAKVKAILVNIFGGIVRCDLIAEGVIDAVREVHVSVPVVVRLEGTNADTGRRLLQAAHLDIVPAADLLEAARKAVAAAKGELS